MKFFIFFIAIFCFNIDNHGSASAHTQQQFVTHSQWLKYSNTYSYKEKFKTRKISSGKKQVSMPSFFAGASVFVYVMIFLVILILILIILMATTGSFSKLTDFNLKPNSYRHSGYDNIENADLEGDLNEALAFKLFKEAVRIQYLILIRTLNNRNMVVWKMDKTNGNYLREMYGRKGFDIFQKLTLYFDQIWYGDIEITETDYQTIVPVFNKLTLIVTASE